MMWMVRFVPASFWDINDNGYDIGDAGALLIFIVGLGTALWAVTKFILLPQIHTMVTEIVIAEVDRATAPIQEFANGGYSLPDVARKGEWIGESQKVIAAHLGIELPPDMTLARNVPHGKQDD